MQSVQAQRFERQFDVNGSEGVARPFVDDEGEKEALLFLIGVHACGDDAHVGEAIPEVEAPKKLAVEIKAVRIVSRIRLQEVQQPRFRRRYRAPQFGVAERLVADEVYAGDLRDRAFPDFINEIHAIVVELDDFRFDLRLIITLPPIDLENPLNIALRASRLCKARTL